MSTPNKNSLSLSELSALTPDDRMAVMNMVKDGEMSINEAIASVQSQAKQKSQGKAVALTNNIMKKFGKQKGQGLGRQGAMKKNRGRLNIEIVVQRASAFSVLIVDVKEGRDLMPMNINGDADPYVKIRLLPDPSNSSKKKTAVRKGTRHPNFQERFTWEIRTGTDLEASRLHISVWDHGTFRRNQFMGSFSFSLAEIFEDDAQTCGWFKLLDANKGDTQNIPYRLKKKDEQLVAKQQPKRPLPDLPPTPTDKPGDAPPPLPARNPSQISLQQMSQPLPPTPTIKASGPGEKYEDVRLAGHSTVLQPGGRPAMPVPPTPQPVQQPAPVPVQTKRLSQQPTPQEKLTIDSFTYLKVLGQGSFGKVLMCEKKGGSDVYAIKVLKKESVIEDDDVEATLVERRVLSLGGACPFLTHLHATFQTADRLFFVMEFITGGDLMFHIQKSKVFTFEQAQFYVGEICIGLWFLHEHGIVYRDLKLDNVMLAADGHIKIADFGMCKENIFGAGTTTTFCGTPGYLAPEIIQELPYGSSVDWWSLGVLSYEMLVGDSPFDGDDDDALFEQILHAEVHYPRKLTAPSKSLIQGFLTRNPQQRLGIAGKSPRDDLKTHAFFSGLDWVKLEKKEIPPPFKPTVKSDKEASNFDSEFTDEDPSLSPPNPIVVANIDQDLFNGFSFAQGHFSGRGSSSAPMVEEIVPKGGSLAGHSWYRPDIPREEVAKALQGKPPGTFFVRESASQPGCYAIAMLTAPSKIWNGLIKPATTATGVLQYKLFNAQKFSSLPELIDFYCVNPIIPEGHGQPICLRKP